MQLRNGIVERKITFLTIGVNKICHIFSMFLGGLFNHHYFMCQSHSVKGKDGA